jgi:hypothetical protein
MRVATVLLAFAYLATLYLIMVLVTVHRGALQVGLFHGRRHGGHRATQGQESIFTLQDGHTILGVGETTQGMRFYLGNDVIDEQTYE